MSSSIHKRASPTTRFWVNVVKTDGCWIWTGNFNAFGYGRIGNNGKRELAHRFSWVLHYGPIPKGLIVCHHCDNTACVRPDHLFIGTQQDNMDDMISKNRQAGQFQPKTHCKWGHPLSGENLQQGKRQKHCRTCRRAFNRKYRSKDYEPKKRN